MNKLNNAEIDALTSKIITEIHKSLKYDFTNELKAIEKFKKTKDFEVLNKYHKAVLAIQLLKTILNSAKSPVSIDYYNGISNIPMKKIKFLGDNYKMFAVHLGVHKRNEVRDLIILAQMESDDIKSLIEAVKTQL